MQEQQEHEPTPPDEVTPSEAAVAIAPHAAELSPAACGACLAELFPALFSQGLAQGPVRPIKLRIQVDIQQRAPGVFSKRALSIFLSRYTTGNAYLKALAAAPHRFDLDGQPAGDISVEHRRLAAEELARRREVHLARRAAERDAQCAREAAARQERIADEQARRERAGLLRQFEATTLTKANFCALKGVAEPALDALLVQARQERAERPPERLQAPWRDERGGRGERPPARDPRRRSQ